MLEHAAPLGQPWSVCNSDIECVPGIPSRNDLESRGQWHPFSLSRKNPKMHIWCKFDDPISKQIIVETSQISQNFETKWPWRWKSMTSTNFLSAPSCLLEHIDVQVCVDIYMNNACIVVARARPAVPLGLWSITSSLRGNLYVPRLHKFIKWFADNDVAHRN